jgi:hypothetical protein
VIGNSHSGILVCRNLYEYSQKNGKSIKILNFRRRGIKYAKYLEKGIVFDSTGLKGDTADWAREVMEGPKCDSNILRQIDIANDEAGAYKAHLPDCTHVIYAIGYAPNPLPAIYLDGKRREEDLVFDMHTSGFHLGDVNGKRVKALFGCGIAFPEEVEDPEGHIEKAVGLGKFYKFAERVKGDWAKVA